MDDLGTVKAFTAEEVKNAVDLSRAAQQIWKSSSFAKRRLLLRTIQRFITENVNTIVRVACRDSGKTKIDAYMGEVLVTCEKIRWLCAQGERWLGPEYRDSGLLNLLKTSRVEFVPIGVVGAIVPWNCERHGGRPPPKSRAAEARTPHLRGFRRANAARRDGGNGLMKAARRDGGNGLMKARGGARGGNRHELFVGCAGGEGGEGEGDPAAEAEAACENRGAERGRA